MNSRQYIRRREVNVNGERGVNIGDVEGDIQIIRDVQGVNSFASEMNTIDGHTKYLSNDSLQKLIYSVILSVMLIFVFIGTAIMYWKS